MKVKEVEQAVADLAYWEELGKVLGWKVYGFTFRTHASYTTGKMWETIQLTGRQRDDIMRAVAQGG